MNKIYLDNAASTKVDERVLAAMLPFLREQYGNPSSIYQSGREADAALSAARAKIAGLLHCRPDEVYFTSGGTESDNFALKGVAFSKPGGHIITSAIEHPALLKSCRFLEKMGYTFSYIKPDPNGFMHAEDVKAALQKDTILISIMMANNEIGSIQDIDALSKIAHENGILFHSDAVQAAGSLPIDLARQNIDLLSLSAHKLHGPKGIGALCIKNGFRVENLLHGGAQERGRRSGTENVAFAVGFAEALSLAAEHREERNQKTAFLRDMLWQGIQENIPNCHLNGAYAQRLSNNLNVLFDGIDAEALLIRLDMQGIAASAGSACTAGSLEASHVLLALGLSEKQAKSSLRFSLSHENSEAEIKETISVLTGAVNAMRLC